MYGVWEGAPVHYCTRVMYTYSTVYNPKPKNLNGSFSSVTKYYIFPLLHRFDSRFRSKIFRSTLLSFGKKNGFKLTSLGLRFL